MFSHCKKYLPVYVATVPMYQYKIIPSISQGIVFLLCFLTQLKVKYVCNNTHRLHDYENVRTYASSGI